MQQDEQNTDFIYFKMHDRDGNGMLDGTELTRMFMEDDHDSEFDEELMRVCRLHVPTAIHVKEVIRVAICPAADGRAYIGGGRHKQCMFCAE